MKALSLYYLLRVPLEVRQVWLFPAVLCIHCPKRYGGWRPQWAARSAHSPLAGNRRCGAEIKNTYAIYCVFLITKVDTFVSVLRGGGGRVWFTCNKHGEPGQCALEQQNWGSLKLRRHTFIHEGAGQRMIRYRIGAKVIRNQQSPGS